jgi:GNAT superfamily N-acetyltransferase
MRDYFARVVGDRWSAWWVARVEDQIVGFTLIDGENIDHLYVQPGWRRRGIGLSLLNKAKALSPRQLELWTFQCNTDARAFMKHRVFAPRPPRRGTTKRTTFIGQFIQSFRIISQGLG